MKDLLIQAIETVVKRYPAVLPHLSPEVLEVLKHYGPGDHPGTGTSQDVHGGDGGNAPNGLGGGITDQDYKDMIDKVAKEFNYDSSKISISDIKKTNNLGEKVFGEYDANTGIVTVYSSNIDLSDEDLVRDVISHEVTHAKFDEWREKNTELLPTFEQDKDLYLGTWGAKVSSYSKYFWDKHEELISKSDLSNPLDKIFVTMSYNLAINETLSEISRRNSTTYLNPITLTDEWEALYNSVIGNDNNWKELYNNVKSG